MVSLCLRGSVIVPLGFQGQDKIFIASEQPYLIKANTYLHALAIDCVCVAEWLDVWCACPCVRSLSFQACTELTRAFTKCSVNVRQIRNESERCFV